MIYPTYDLLNRLIKVTKNGNMVSEYAYDPEGFRVVKKAKGETTHYIFQGTEPIFEKNLTTGKIKSFVYALGKHLARVDGRIGDIGAMKYWYVTDHLGSVRAVTDKDGKKVWSADYLAFGKQYIKDGDFEELHSFTGKEYDPDTGLHYYNARWYDADLGRFISEDPVADPNNPNLYSYGANNPMRLIDPTGLYGYDTQTGQISHSDGTITDTKGNVISTPPSTGGSGSSESGDSGGSEGSTSEPTEPGPTTPEGPNGISNQGNVKTSRNGLTQIIYDTKGREQSKTTFDKDGNIKTHIAYIYEEDGKRTETKYSYTQYGILVTTREQDKGLFGLGYWTKDTTIKGYNNQEDLKNNNWNFSFNVKGQIHIGDDVKEVNGDLLLNGFVSYLEEKSIKYGDWLTKYSIKGWDVTNVKDLSEYSYRVQGKLYNANTFGNIEVGYIGQYYALPELTKFGSFIVHLDRHGFKHLDDEWRDEKWMDYGARLYKDDFDYKYR